MGCPAEPATSLARTGFEAWQQDQLAEAGVALSALLEHADEVDDREERFHALHLLACVASSSGDYRRSRQLHEEVLGMSQELEFQGGIASSLFDIAMIDRVQGNVESARERCQQARAAFEQGGYHQRLAVVDAALADLVKE